MVKDDFLNYLRGVVGRSFHTITAYKTDLNQFYNYLNPEHNIYGNEINALQNIKVFELDGFINYLDELGCNNNTKNRKIATLKAFFNYLKRIDIIENDITEKLNILKSEKKDPKFLTIDECGKLLENIRGENSIRDKAIVLLLLTSGLRANELVSLNLECFKDGCITFIGKGNKWATIPVAEIAITAINSYLRVRPKVESNALFISERGNRLSKRALQHMMKRRLIQIGREDCSTHTMRHTTASLMYQNGTDILSVQQILRHSNISTTQIYTHLGGGALRSAVENNPISIK